MSGSVSADDCRGAAGQAEAMVPLACALGNVFRACPVVLADDPADAALVVLLGRVELGTRGPPIGHAVRARRRVDTSLSNHHETPVDGGRLIVVVNGCSTTLQIVVVCTHLSIRLHPGGVPKCEGCHWLASARTKNHRLC